MERLLNGLLLPRERIVTKDVLRGFLQLLQLLLARFLPLLLQPRPLLQLITELLLLIDVAQAPSAQVATRLAVRCLLNLRSCDTLKSESCDTFK